MGAYLERPVTDKESSDGTSRSYSYGSSSMQGWRVNMEDAHINILTFDKDDDAALFAVFDGHGGQEVAQYCRDHVPGVLTSLDEYKEGHFKEALGRAFLRMDEDILGEWPEALRPYQQPGGGKIIFERESDPYQESCPGCTAVSCLLKNKKCYIANAGDSRIVMCRGGVAIELSTDHKPELEQERRRIEEAGGYITDGRVNGNLNLTRAIGDFAYKKDKSIPAAAQIITANPDLSEIDITPEDEFLVLGCDGVWDRKTSQEVVDFMKERLDGREEGTPLSRIVEDLLDAILSPGMTQTDGLGCDNMSCILVDLHNGRPAVAAVAAPQAGREEELGSIHNPPVPGLTRRTTIKMEDRPDVAAPPAEAPTVESSADGAPPEPNV